jgi:hypothetical protein
MEIKLHALLTSALEEGEWSVLYLGRFTPGWINLKSEKVVPVPLTEHQTMKAYWGSGGIAPLILCIGTRWR